MSCRLGKFAAAEYDTARAASLRMRLMKDLSEAAAFTKYDHRLISPRLDLLLASHVLMQIHTHASGLAAMTEPHILASCSDARRWGKRI